MNKMKKFVNNIFDKIKTSVKKAHKEHVIKKFFKRKSSICNICYC